MFWAALALLFILPTAAPAARIVDAFAPATASAWQPFLGAPAPVSAASGIAFPLPFSRNVDRAAWDKSVSLDLSAATAFEIELSCPAPEAIRQFGLYFKSGAGWYAASTPLPGGGPRTLVVAKSDFTTEGTPAGWAQISGIRLSPWKGEARDTALVMHRMATVEGRALVLVQGTSSCPDNGARAVAAKTTERVSRLLIEAGIGHTIITDDDLPKGALAQATTALLPYNPTPTAPQLKALTAFLKRGGKLGVFYGASPTLARAMGFKLGPYIKAKRPDRWRTIVIDDPIAWLMPPRIWQQSPNLMPAYPAKKGSRTIAFWENARGVRQPEPAVVVSPHGFWMSHILLNDDATSKKELLVSLCAHLDPTVWAPAAARAIQEAGRINDFHSLPHALAEIERALPTAVRPDETRALLDDARALSAQIHAALTAGQSRQALRLARRQRNLLLRADAAVQPPRPGEFVGVWDHDGTGYVPGDWTLTATHLAAHGVTAIFPNLAWGGCAHYPSKHLPGSDTLRLYGDQVAAVLAAAKPLGMQVHVWMVLWQLTGAPDTFVARMKKEGRLQITSSGSTRQWLSPHHPANRRLLREAVVELATTYPTIDGIHLDYIRLPDSLSCYSASTRTQFESATQQKCKTWPDDVLPGGRRQTEFRRWRTGDITALVTELRAALRQANPTVKLSAAVFGAIQPDGGNIAQYWPDWLRTGSVDFLVPMNYTESSTEFAALVRRQVAQPNAAGRILPGLGVTAAESRLDPAQVARQIALLRQLGCPGFVLFDLSGTLRDETLPALRQGITRPGP
ncbi:MAG: family 10 glycosylhydrolase [Kiritimatiellia bacterium]|nr:family 10 glycosylhydrolase [Kiritimatiellia bacterium]